METDKKYKKTTTHMQEHTEKTIPKLEKGDLKKDEVDLQG